MEYSPPPLFKQGTSARVKVVLFSLISLILLVADSRLRSLTAIREAVGTLLYPLQVAAMLPRDGVHLASNYFTSVSTLQRENRTLLQEQVANAQTLQQAVQLAAENEHLRNLLSATERVTNKAVLSEILYVARDPFSRKIVLDRGSQHGVEAGNPVIDDVGVVGQITRVYPFTSEVTLLTDKEQAIPVQILRTGLRSIAYGQGHSGALELRFLPTNVDIKSGDMVITSGIDGIYPAGLAVANVVQVETKSGDAFARITCQPLAGVDRHRHLLVLLAAHATPQGGAATGTHATPAALQHAGGVATRDGKPAVAGAAAVTPGASAMTVVQAPVVAPTTPSVNAPAAGGNLTGATTAAVPTTAGNASAASAATMPSTTTATATATASSPAAQPRPATAPGAAKPMSPQRASGALGSSAASPAAVLGNTAPTPVTPATPSKSQSAQTAPAVRPASSVTSPTGQTNP